MKLHTPQNHITSFFYFIILLALGCIGVDAKANDNYLQGAICADTTQFPMADFCADIDDMQTMYPLSPDVMQVGLPTPVTRYGCNLEATADLLSLTDCDLSPYQVVWYKVVTDSRAQTLKVRLQSTDSLLWSPVMAVFEGDCSALDPIHSELNGQDCFISSTRSIVVDQLLVAPDSEYFIAVGASNGIGGHFELQVSTEGSLQDCANSQSLTLVGRDSTDVPTASSFYPGEKIVFNYRIEYRVDPIGIGNNCQWLQGMVPVFGNAYDLGTVMVEGEIPLSQIVKWHPDSAVDYNWDNNRYSSYYEDGKIKIAHFFSDQDHYDGLHAFEPGTYLPAGWYASSPGNAMACVPGSDDPDETFGIPAGCATILTMDFNFSIEVKDTLPSDAEFDVFVYNFSDGSIGCWSSQFCTGDIPAHWPSESALPSANFNRLVDKACAPYTTTLVASDSQPGDSVVWTVYGPDTLTLYGRFVDVDFLEVGEYDVRCQVFNRFGSDTKVIQNFISIQLNPAAQFSADYVYLTNESQNADQYEWYVDDSFVSDETDLELQVVGPGIVEVTLIAINSCGRDTIVQHVSISSTSVVDNRKNLFVLYPNPTTDQFAITIQQPIGSYALQLIDMRGRLVYEEDVVEEAQHNVHVSGLVKGTYVVRIIAQGESYYGRLVITKN